MYTGNVWGIALLIAGFLAALTGFQLLIAAVFARRAEAALRTLREKPALSGVVGAVTVLVVIVALAVSGQFGGPGKFLAALGAAGMSFPLAGGLATVSRFVGERMPSPADAGRPWRATLRGGVTCGLAFVVPVVGWFLVLPAAAVMGLGAVALSFFAPSPAASVAPQSAEAGAAA
jgi:hypothetical protein